MCSLTWLFPAHISNLSSSLHVTATSSLICFWLLGPNYRESRDEPGCVSRLSASHFAITQAIGSQLLQVTATNCELANGFCVSSLPDDTGRIGSSCQLTHVVTGIWRSPAPMATCKVLRGDHQVLFPSSYLRLDTKMNVSWFSSAHIFHWWFWSSCY